MANNIFIDFLPPWVETGIQPAFYDKESGTVLQQTARMYAKVNELIADNHTQNETIDDYIDKFNELHDYVYDYFDNLDVQEEINNKLNKMVIDGTMYNIINEQIFGSLNNRVLANTTDIDELQTDQELNVKKGEVASVGMDMLTQEVKSALTGGSTPVVGRDSVNTQNIMNGAVTIIKVDEKIRDNFDINTTPIELLDATAGFYWPDGNVVGGNLRATDNSDNRKKYVYNLQAGKTYRYTGYNPGGSPKGMIIGTAVGSPVIAFSPDMGKLNKDVYTTGVPADIQGTDIIFSVGESGLKAFISVYNDNTLSSVKYPNLLAVAGGLSVVNSITPYDRTVQRSSWATLQPDQTISEVYTQYVGTDATDTASKNPYHYSSIADRPDFNINIFTIHKNHTYKATGQQRYTNAGFALYDNSCKLAYCSMNESKQNVDSFSYEFTATFDGFAVIQNGNNLEANLYEAVESQSEGVTYRMESKAIAYNGDSITESRLTVGSTSYNGGAYPKLISDITNSTYYNYSHGGATLAYAPSQNYHRICREIDNMNGVYDAIIFSGGINDYWQNIPLGDYDEGDYTGTINDGTVCGGLESIFRQAINKWCGKPIMFVITHKCKNTPVVVNQAGYTFNQCYEKIKGICKKYSIPYYDAYSESGLNGGIEIMSTMFMTAGSSGHPDGTHPNESAYMKYYVPQVIKMIERNLPYQS